ncbi:phosphoribosyltransferase family protein [Helicobacter sp. 11S02629-2]|uniref:ComF family protein n=1 Tax=Helicobacter sp. 11S02629-2 TaxID=1476195 RepID=UPI000BA6611C|nr:phosphoribosyltransferase family protein [Helicobacter sp. 11S02629-2]PAF45696.1 hypothetical protein BKH40_02105 [Helicobacter sp. 11S02629-2]
MRCIGCSKVSLALLCRTCIANLSILHSQRNLDSTRIISSFAYSEAREFLLSKYSLLGSRIYKKLSEVALSAFFKTYSDLLDIDRRHTAIIAVDSTLKGAYSHSSIIAQGFKRYGFKVAASALESKAKNANFFHLLSANERAMAKREFKLREDFKFDSCILVDDIITTGATLKEAISVVKASGVKVLFAYTLSDARY